MPKNYDPKHPILEMEYTGESYFMTRDWNPYGDGDPKSAKDQYAEAIKVMEDADKKPKPFPTLSNAPDLPPVFWFFKTPKPQI